MLSPGCGLRAAGSGGQAESFFNRLADQKISKPRPKPVMGPSHMLINDPILKTPGSAGS